MHTPTLIAPLIALATWAVPTTPSRALQDSAGKLVLARAHGAAPHSAFSQEASNGTQEAPDAQTWPTADEILPVIDGLIDISDQFELYDAIESVDMVKVARRLNKQTEEELADLEKDGRDYALSKAATTIKKDIILRNTILAVRARVARSRISYVPYVPDDLPALKWTGREFRLRLAFSEIGDRVGAAIFRGDALEPQPSDFSAASWTRTTCGRDAEEMRTVCNIRLHDVPAALKERLENEYGKTIKVRWVWTGFPAKMATSYLAPLAVIRIYTTKVRTPRELQLQFVDEQNNVVWTAK
jgi:hypothetical protein